jgi:photosystem II stability/assembly factor-like uncharacterized protein
MVSSCGNDDKNDENNTGILLDSVEILFSDIPYAEYRDLIFTDDTTGYAISEGFVVKTTDGGKSWNAQALPVNAVVVKIQFTDKHTGYIITGINNTYGTLLFKTVDGGAHWDTIHLNLLGGMPSGMFFIDNNTGFITGSNLFAKTTDGGEHWTDLRKENIFLYNDVNFKNDRDGTVTSVNCVYLQTHDGGVTWDSLKYDTANQTLHLLTVYFADHATYATSNSSALLDLDHNREIVGLPGSSPQFVFFDSKKSIALSFYLIGEYSMNGILFATDNGWETYSRKDLSGLSSPIYGVIAKMSEDRAMVLCAKFPNTEVLTIKF